MGCAPSVHISAEAPGAYLGGKQAAEGAQGPWALLQGPGALPPARPSDPYQPPSQRSYMQFGPMRFRADQLHVLLAFSKEDSQCKAFRQACEEAGFKCTLTTEMQSVMAAFLAANHDIIILDHRNPRQLDAQALCRAIRSSKVSENTVIVGVVRRRDGDLPVMPLLSAGFTRRYVENPSRAACYTELLQLQFGEVRSQLKLRAGNSIFRALEQTQDAVEITGEDHVVQYANPAFQTALGCEWQELVGKELEKLPVAKESGLLDSISCCIRTGKRPQDMTVIPVSGQGGKIRHYVSIIRLNDRDGKAEKTPQSAQSDPNVDSQLAKLKERRKSSAGARSEASRASVAAAQKQQPSLARIQSVTIEAPITQVINIIAAAQGDSSEPVAQALDRALEILRTSELYSPHFGAKDSDPHVNDLLGGLLSDGLWKISGDDYGLSTKVLPRRASSLTAMVSLQDDVPLHIVEALENEESWDFDIFELEAATQKRALSYLAMKIFARFGICEMLRCPEATMRAWLQVIEATYHASNPYHNSSHAADVLHATAYFLSQERVKCTMDSVDETAALIAAAVHDLDHPGRTNPFLCNLGSELAILYNDFAVLESHHASLAFQVTLRDEKSNIFKNLERGEYRKLRQIIIDMVLATEMTKHFEHVNKFVTRVVRPLSELEESEKTEAVLADIDAMLHKPETRAMIKRMVIKCADVSNPCRPLEQCIQWAARISEEYFCQTEEEKRRGLPVVMPGFDRSTCSIPKAQMSFINYFLMGMYDAWDEFVDLPVLLHHLDNNFRYWKDLDDMSVRGLRPPPPT